MNDSSEICKCPICGNAILPGKYGYYCSDYKNCKVNIYYNATERLGGKKITKSQTIALLTKGVTSRPVELISKSGKPYKAYLVYKYNKENQYPNNISIEFDN